MSHSPPPPPSSRPRGRPRIFDENRRQTLCTLIAVGLTRNEAARQVGVKPSSVVYAARTDPVFAQRLKHAQVQRANRPPDLADVGRRAWRATARLLESRSPEHFRLPRSKFEQWLADPRFTRAVRRIVRKQLRNWGAVDVGELARGSAETAAAYSRPESTPDYCFENSPLLRKQPETKTIFAPADPIIVSKPPMHRSFHPVQKQ